MRTIGFLLFPGMLQLDFTGAYGVFSQVPGVTPLLVAGERRTVVSSDGLAFQPHAAFADDPECDILVVPGGGGILGLLSDGATLAFLAGMEGRARHIASVCTGSLVLGAAGLLRGRRATTHWQSLDLLPYFGAVAVEERVVWDGDIVTSAGVTSGIDMALALVGRVWGDDAARTIQLGMEYDPRPPYASGSPRTAPAAIRRAVEDKGAERQKARREAVLKAAAALGLP